MPKPIYPQTEKVIKRRWANKAHPQNRLVEVLWMDAMSVSSDEWLTDSEVAAIAPIKSLSIGYLWVETPNFITLVSLVNENHVSHGITIPRGMIVEVRDIG